MIFLKYQVCIQFSTKYESDLSWIWKKMHLWYSYCYKNKYKSFISQKMSDSGCSVNVARVALEINLELDNNKTFLPTQLYDKTLIDCDGCEGPAEWQPITCYIVSRHFTKSRAVSNTPAIQKAHMTEGQCEQSMPQTLRIMLFPADRWGWSAARLTFKRHVFKYFKTAACPEPLSEQDARKQSTSFVFKGCLEAQWIQYKIHVIHNYKRINPFFNFFYIFFPIHIVAFKTVGYLKSFMCGVISYYSWTPSSLPWPPAHSILLSVLSLPILTLLNPFLHPFFHRFLPCSLHAGGSRTVATGSGQKEQNINT